jgi:hypothetical protein
MLSISSYSKLHSEHKEHGWALRAIGQDLADILLENLEIQFTGRFYVARGRGKTRGSSAAKKKGSVRKILNKLKSGEPNGNAQKAEAVAFERTYTLEQIQLLGERGKSRRKNSPLSPDINVLGERLRAVGKMIEAKGGQLIKLAIDNYRVAFTYRDSRGEFYNEEHTTPALYRSQKGSHSRRLAGKERDPWNNTRK